MTGLRYKLCFALVATAAALCVWKLGAGIVPANAQQNNQAGESTGAGIKAETRLVLVDTVVTDKKGNYVTDLGQQSFKVWEDDKEQPIKSFSSETSAALDSKDQQHYLVLFFDNSTMETGDQSRARDAAAKFIDANAGPNR